MLTANQFHKQSGIKVEFQEFLQRMKATFGENFMDNVNAGKVKLQEVQKALGLKETALEKPKTAAPSRKVKAIKATKSSASKSATGSGMKCSSCEQEKLNASGKKSNVARNLVIVAGLGAVVFWAMKNRK